MNDEVIQEGESRTGTHYIIRYPTQDDLESLWRYANRLSQERTFVRFQGEELTLEQEQKALTTWLENRASGEATTLFLIVDGEVQGIGGANRQSRTESHIASLALSIDASVRGQGLGETLLRAVLDEAKRSMKELRLFVLEYKEPNTTAKALYEKLGFKEYGQLPGGTQQRGEYVDAVLMYREV